MEKHKHQLFPIEFLEDIIRHFNGVIKTSLLEVTVNKLEIKFPKRSHANKGVVIGLFTKMAEAFKAIKSKYLPDEDSHTQVQLEFEPDNEEDYIIEIIGVSYIPPGKILNLFDLILWYYIRYTTGDKPSNSELGRKLTNDWKQEDNYLRFKINKSDRELSVSAQGAPCFICSDEAYNLNDWVFRSRTGNKTTKMQTRVCQKHRSKLI